MPKLTQSVRSVRKEGAKPKRSKPIFEVQLVLQEHIKRIAFRKCDALLNYPFSHQVVYMQHAGVLAFFGYYQLRNIIGPH